MKQLIILFLLSIGFTSFANSDLYNLLKDQTFDLTYGITIPEQPKYGDFSHRFTGGAIVPAPRYGFDEMIPFYEAAEKWYHCDFAEDPFDGVIEIYAVGQPSASVNATLIISCLIGLVMFYKRKQAITRLSL